MTVADDTTQTGVSDDDDGVAAFLSSFQDEDPKKKGALSDQDEEAPDIQVDVETPEDEGNESEEDQTRSDDPDQSEVEVKVGEEVKKFKLGDLKRLAGQEAALTQKSQKASETLKKAEESAQRAAVATQALLERAQARFKPYQELNTPANWALLAQQLSPEDYQQLQKDVTTSEADVKFLTQELDGYMQDQRQKAQTAHAETAKATVAELSDPEKGIKGFSQALHADMIAYAERNGVPEMRSVVSAPVIRLLHKAMLYDKALEAAKKAQAKVTKAIDKTARVLKPGAGNSTTSSDGRSKAMQALKQRPDDPDAIAGAFAASF